MTRKLLCKYIEIKTIKHPTMSGEEVVTQFYCHAGEIENYIDDCPEDCNYYNPKYCMEK